MTTLQAKQPQTTAPRTPSSKPSRFQLVKLEERFRIVQLEDRIAPSSSGGSMPRMAAPPVLNC